jgi:uncharacterized membrane protein HdeD (DUF308 family)
MKKKLMRKKLERLYKRVTIASLSFFIVIIANKNESLLMYFGAIFFLIIGVISLFFAFNERLNQKTSTFIWKLKNKKHKKNDNK